MDRLPNVPSLSQKLPKGTESGKEFARIVDLLLFHEARRSGRNINIFNDASGDYFGLDSFERDFFRKDATTGYQYKFYSSPLSSQHKNDIEQSLKKVIENQKKLKLEKWVLVTPDDLSGGGEEWFQGLKKKYKLEFDIEHIGHTKLLDLFIQNPPMCYYYYHELLPEGAAKKKTIQQIRMSYDKGLVTWHGHIQFVGIPIYKQETATGIPMEDIYIPLNVVPEAVSESGKDVKRTNPVEFLAHGKRYVILGDPGSGKSTLLKFLAISGIHEPLCKKYNTQQDDRLPVFVMLRRYADKLKSNENLPLLDYIIETVRADFNLTSADIDFLEYYLETGQTVLLFDGMDELPNPQFKQMIRDRIRALATTYPGNTIIVTSRIIGYDGVIRFDEKEFSHYRVAKLQQPEMKQFVADWYRVRVKNPKERDDNINDLVRILEDENRTAIRELAQNPLLLAIITLVHRIEAVLPDERVVLYKKCTETLLQTWHTWKYRGGEEKNKTRIERRNRERMEAIAYWMHKRLSGSEANQRAVVPYDELKEFLANYIANNEKCDPEDYPGDLAEDFLDFIKSRTGLLIEAGDRQYSFVHLTFQEYLTAAHIYSVSENKGSDGIWDMIKNYCSEASWHEVIRLLIAERKPKTQEDLLQSILTQQEGDSSTNRALLLGGLLLDSLEPAEERTGEILHGLITEVPRVDDIGLLRRITAMLKAIYEKDTANAQAFKSEFTKVLNSAKDMEKTSLTLVLFVIGKDCEIVDELTGRIISQRHREGALYRLLLCNTATQSDFELLEKDIERLEAAQDVFATYFTNTTFVASALQVVVTNIDRYYASRGFEAELVSLIYIWLFSNYEMFNLLTVFSSKFIRKVDFSRVLARARALDRALALDRARTLDRALALALDRALVRDLDLARALARDLELDLDLDQAWALEQARDLNSGRGNFWKEVQSTPEIHELLIDIICEIFRLQPKVHWQEALRLVFLPQVPKRSKFLNEDIINHTETAFEKGNAGETEIYTAARLLLFDAWLYIIEYHKTPNETLFGKLIDQTRKIDSPPLVIAHLIRDIAYGNGKKAGELAKLVKSGKTGYKEIFDRCYWIPRK